MIYQKKHGTFEKRCKHYAGIDFTDPDKQCNAGVLMQGVVKRQSYQYQYNNKGAVYTSHRCMPCFKDDDPLGVCSCDKQEFPTEEEIAEDKANRRKGLSQILLARTSIMNHCDNRTNVSGNIDCPVCKAGMIAYAVASNGHVRAICATKDCVSWIE